MKSTGNPPCWTNTEQTHVRLHRCALCLYSVFNVGFSKTQMHVNVESRLPLIYSWHESESNKHCILQSHLWTFHNPCYYKKAAMEAADPAGLTESNPSQGEVFMCSTNSDDNEKREDWDEKRSKDLTEAAVWQLDQLPNTPSLKLQSNVYLKGKGSAIESRIKKREFNKATDWMIYCRWFFLNWQGSSSSRTRAS